MKKCISTQSIAVSMKNDSTRPGKNRDKRLSFEVRETEKLWKPVPVCLMKNRLNVGPHSCEQGRLLSWKHEHFSIIIS